MPKRRKVAATARPPIPAPTMATERGLGMGCSDGSFLGCPALGPLAVDGGVLKDAATVRARPHVGAAPDAGRSSAPQRSVLWRKRYGTILLREAKRTRASHDGRPWGDYGRGAAARPGLLDCFCTVRWGCLVRKVELAHLRRYRRSHCRRVPDT